MNFDVHIFGEGFHRFVQQEMDWFTVPLGIIFHVLAFLVLLMVFIYGNRAPWRLTGFHPKSKGSCTARRAASALQQPVQPQSGRSQSQNSSSQHSQGRQRHISSVITRQSACQNRG